MPKVTADKSGEVVATVNDAIQAQVAHRRAQAVQMRVDGHTMDTIALALEYASTADASRDIIRALEQGLAEQRHSVEVYREIELRRLDKMHQALQPAVERGVPRAIEIDIKVSERRSKLGGWDATTKLEITTLDAIDSQIAELTAQLANQGVDFESL